MTQQLDWNSRDRWTAEEWKTYRRNRPLEERMKGADWWYDYSDDGEVRSRGAEEIRQIMEDIKTLSETDPDRARQLWAKYCRS
jgi:hypothetical protein